MTPPPNLTIAPPPTASDDAHTLKIERRKRRRGMLLGTVPGVIMLALAPVCMGSLLTAALWLWGAFIAFVLGVGRLIYLRRSQWAQAEKRYPVAPARAVAGPRSVQLGSALASVTAAEPERLAG